MIRGEVRYEADAGGLLPKFLYSCKQESYYADRKHLPLKYPLEFGDIVIDDSRCPSFLWIATKQSKTHPFLKELNLYVGRTGIDHCPPLALLNFLQASSISLGPLFLFGDGHEAASCCLVTRHSP